MINVSDRIDSWTIQDKINQSDRFFVYSVANEAISTKSQILKMCYYLKSQGNDDSSDFLQQENCFLLKKENQFYRKVLKTCTGKQ